MQRSALCRSRRELSNTYFLAKFGLDPAENEPCQLCPTDRRPPPVSGPVARPSGARLMENSVEVEVIQKSEAMFFSK